VKPEDARQLISGLADADVPEGLASAIDARLATAANERPVKETRRRSALSILLAAAAGGLGIQLYVIFSGRIGFDLVSPVVQRWGEWIVDLPASDPSVYSVAAGLLIYAVSLFIVSRD